MLVQPDYETVQKSLRWSFPLPGQIFEIRSLTTYRGQASVGYFNDPILAANTICVNDSDGIGGTYVTINPVMPEAFLRCSNHMVAARAGSFTSDREILERRGVLLDFDPVRISGISSTDAEHEMALQYMQEVTEALTLLHGFPVPCLVDSGNGGHARYILETMPNDQATTDLIKATLQALHSRFSNKRVEIDRSVFNAARIQRVAGTVARKGEHTPERPHRQSRIIREFDPFDVLSVDRLRRLITYYAPIAPVKPRGGPSHAAEYPSDEQLFRALNAAARGRVHDWVPNMLGSIARPSGEGYRIRSEDIGRPNEEDISIRDGGVKDFGVHDLGDETEGRRTPISLLSELLYSGNKRDAAEALALCLNVPVNEFEGKMLVETPAGMPAALMGVPQAPFAAARTFLDIANRPVKPVTFTVPRFIAENTHTVLSAPAKLGKSTLMYNTTLQLLFGMPVIGRASRACNVLFCALEETDARFQRKLWEQYTNLLSTQWGNSINQETQDEAFRRLRFFTKDSREQGGIHGMLPQGKMGADHIKEILRSDTSRPWFVIIEPVNKFHDHSMYSKNLNALEYEQIEIINDIIRPDEYTCSIVTIKHDRKSPAGGIRGQVNLMESISGSVAQSGAPDAQIQFIGKGFDNFEGLNWLIIQSRDFGKEKIPIISDGVSWIKPPPDYEIPDFDDYINTAPDGRGRKLKDPLTDQKIIGELTKEVMGLRPRELEARLNIPYQIVLRRLKYMNEMGIVHEDRRNQRDVLYLMVGAATMPVSKLPDLT